MAFNLNTKQIPNFDNAENGQASGSSSDDFEHLIFDIEEVECKMTDIEEREQSDESNSGRGDARSVRGSILHSPKNYHFNPASRISEMSIMSSVNLDSHTQLNTQSNPHYYTAKQGHL